MTERGKILVALGAIAAAFLVVRARAAPAPAPMPVGTTSLGPLSYPMGTKPYPTDGVTDPGSNFPPFEETGLPPYPTGGFTRDILDETPFPPFPPAPPGEKNPGYDSPADTGIYPGLLI